MGTIVNAIYLSLFVMFCIFTLSRKYMYSAFIFLIFGTRGMAFLPAMTLKPRFFIFLCVFVFCIFNFKYVKRNIKNDWVIRSVFRLCLFFIFLMAFSILYWKLPIFSVMSAGIPYLIPMCIVIFLPLTNREFNKLFTIVFYIAFIATILYIIQCLLGKAILPMSWDQESVKLIAGPIHRFWAVPPFMGMLIHISIFCKKLVPPAFRAISPVLFMSGLLCTMYRTHIATAFLCIFLLMWLTGSLAKNFKSIIVLLVIFAIFGSTLTERVTRNNNSTMRDISSLLSGDLSMAKSNFSNGMTLMYRAGWVLERAAYLVKSPVELMTGLPLTEDNTYMLRKYNFRFGLKNKNGEITQATTPDIAYGMMLTRYGLIGTILLLRMIYLLLRRLYWYRHKNELSVVLFSMLFTEFIAAISSVVLVEPTYWVSVFFLYDYAMRMIVGDPPKRIKSLPAK